MAMLVTSASVEKPILIMAMPRIYLDHNATAPLRPEAREAVIAALDLVGNASAVHGEGRAARAVVEAARRNVARLVGAEDRDIIFTSGATEALNTVLTPHWQDGNERRPLDALLVSATEHASVLKGHRFPVGAVDVLPVVGDGRIDPAALTEALARRKGQRVMLALQTANNETGVLQPVAEAARLVHDAGGLLMVDAVQTAGKLPVDLAELGADLLVVSSHKLGGPSGAGALVRTRESLHLAEPLLRGGGQEKSYRAGTAAIPAIAGFGAAAAAALADLGDDAARLATLCDQLEAGLKAIAPDFVVFGEGAPRLPNTVAFAVPGLSSETVVMALDLAGLAVSSGSACASGKVAGSHVLAAMGVAPELARGLIRVSLGWSTTRDDITNALDIFDRALSSLRIKARERAA
jgi:cysteine desulfurase